MTAASYGRPLGGATSAGGKYFTATIKYLRSSRSLACNRSCYLLFIIIKLATRWSLYLSVGLSFSVRHYYSKRAASGIGVNDVKYDFGKKCNVLSLSEQTTFYAAGRLARQNRIIAYEYKTSFKFNGTIDTKVSQPLFSSECTIMSICARPSPILIGSSNVVCCQNKDCCIRGAKLLSVRTVKGTARIVLIQKGLL